MASNFRTYVPNSQRDPVQTVQQNLSEIYQRQHSLQTARAFWLGELIAGYDPDALPDRDNVQAVYEQLLLQHDDQNAYTNALHHADLLALCTEIAKQYPNRYDQAFAELFGQYDPVAAQAQGRVACVANSFTDQAFLEMTGTVKNRRVAYFHSFDDVCQEVNNGLCEYGILPVESATEGSMAGLLRLIELYSLRICALCYIPTPQNGKTAFALVRKTLPTLYPATQCTLDLIYTPTEPYEIAQLISIASLGSHVLTHTASYAGQDGALFRLRFAINPLTLYPFLLYLLLFCADITPLGLYTIK